jgi:cytochrome P450
MTDLFSDDARRDPYPLYEQVRAASPLVHDPRSGLWMIFDYQGVNRVLSDHESFSSARGPDWMIFTDPPRHTKLRALVSKAFTPRSVAGLEGRIAAISRGLLDRVVARGAMDLVADYALPLPMTVIAELLGIPPADRERFARWNEVLLEMSHTIAGGDKAPAAMDGFIALTGEMGAYLENLLARRRVEPADDLLTRLAAAEVDGGRLTHGEILGFFQLMLLAGSETTTNLIANAVLCFAAHPDQLARLRDEPALIPTAVEEVLRFRSPLQWMYRVATRDVHIHGRVMPAGAMVLAMIGSANHDPLVFPDPTRLDVARSPNPHLAFGHGVHFCLGAPLARMELVESLGLLLDRMPGLELTEEPVSRGTFVLRGYEHVYVGRG